MTPTEAFEFKMLVRITGCVAEVPSREAFSIVLLIERTSTDPRTVIGTARDTFPDQFKISQISIQGDAILSVFVIDEGVRVSHAIIQTLAWCKVKSVFS
jgi:hypothetical protein